MIRLRMDLASYGERLNQLNVLTDIHYAAREHEKVTELTYDSREVKPGTLFVCKGTQFKEEYLKEAIKRGAIGYVSEKKYATDSSVAAFVVSDIRLAMAHLADSFFGTPSKKIQLIGVTGTKGKTTTTYYIKAILDHYLRAQGKKESGLISTIKVVDGQGEKLANNTTPEAIPLQRHIANAVEAGLEYMVVEVSSQALKYHRVESLAFDIGVFLNISLDHISPYEHQDYEDYFQSKMKLFSQSKTVVLNGDATEFHAVAPHANRAEEQIIYSLKQSQADYYGEMMTFNEAGSTFNVYGPHFTEAFYLSMIGRFNVENALAAIAVTTKLGIPVSYAKQALKEVTVPGRMEVEKSRDGLLTTIVDYAHNKLSYENLFSTIRENHPDAHIVAVFGMSGNRSFNRRRELGRVVGQYADEAILTHLNQDEVPPSELIGPIVEDLETFELPYKTILDRSEAIREAIHSVDKKTIVVVAGRGHSNQMQINGTFKETLTDIEFVRKYMAEYEEMKIG